MTTIDLRPAPRKSEYVHTIAVFNVALQGNWQQSNDQLTLTITIAHNADAEFDNGTVAIAQGQQTVYQLNGQRSSMPLSGSTPKFTFVPLQVTSTAQPLLPQGGLPANPPAQPMTMQIKLVFPAQAGVNAPNEVILAVPTGRSWYGTIKVSLPVNNVPRESDEVPLVQRSFGLPSVYGNGLAMTSSPAIAPRATYPVRSHNKVAFYNDASTDAIGTAGAFHDIYTAILQARRFIFIADWSFHPDVYMQRPVNHQPTAPVPGNTPQRASDPYLLGDLLINKVLGKDANGAPDPNVDAKTMLVAIHVWDHVHGPAADDPQSNAAGDRLLEMTKELGYGTKLPTRLLWRTTERSGTLRSHHQKFVALDVPVDPGQPNGKREIKVFFGGLDLTTGRFDWPTHPIDFPPGPANTPNATTPFKVLKDWYNPEINNPASFPRQPWHDIHAQLVGSAAWDFVVEFVGRWEAGKVGAASLNGAEDKTKLVWKKFEELLSSNTNFVQPYDDHSALPPAAGPRPWTVQVLRSMEDKFWQPTSAKATNPFAPSFFKWGIAKTYEKSIHKAYLQAIQRANRFIYIETQYLIGGKVLLGGDVQHSSQRGLGPNKIPEAIVGRILEINAQNPQQDFHVYIVIPMFPEGPPGAAKLRPTRYFQWQTIKWMKEELDQKLKGNRAWTNYLSFYFLGKRAVGGGMQSTGTRNDRVNVNKRYMIYVHSKMMIVDDEWIIIGSANLNERSMAGKVDSEICAAMWPSLGQSNTCRQQIQDFRRDLWSEHLGNAFIGNNPIANKFPLYNYLNPELPDTYNAVQQAATTNRTNFNALPATSVNHLMLWDLDRIFTHNELIIDAEGNGDEWRVAPHSRGPALVAPDEMVR